tara:strand:- start:473 stop:832 length:360 start_codon:yes stop_codon:yes gene_type:complete
MDIESIVDMINNLHINLLLVEMSCKVCIEAKDRVSKDEVKCILHLSSTNEETFFLLANLFYKKIYKSEKYKQIQYYFENIALVKKDIVNKVTSKLRENKVLVASLEQELPAREALVCEI